MDIFAFVAWVSVCFSHYVRVIWHICIRMIKVTAFWRHAVSDLIMLITLCQNKRLLMQIPCYFECKTHIFHIFSSWKIEARLNFEELWTSLQTAHGAAWTEPNVNTFRENHQATSSSSPPLTASQPPTFIILNWSILLQRCRSDSAFHLLPSLCNVGCSSLAFSLLTGQGDEGNMQWQSREGETAKRWKQNQTETFSSVIWHSYHSDIFSFLSVFTHRKAFYIWRRIQKKSYSECSRDR